MNASITDIARCHFAKRYKWLQIQKQGKYRMQVFANIFHNKNALLGKTRYSLYSFCCSIAFQGRSRWIIFISFESQYTRGVQKVLQVDMLDWKTF